MSSNSKNNVDKGLQIELPEELAQGKYSNLAIVAHSASEFVIDFVRVVPNVEKSKVQSRVILNAEQAKRFFLAMRDNIAKYEAQFGEIDLHERQNSSMPMNFGGFQGEA